VNKSKWEAEEEEIVLTGGRGAYVVGRAATSKPGSLSVIKRGSALPRAVDSKFAAFSLVDFGIRIQTLWHPPPLVMRLLPPTHLLSLFSYTWSLPHFRNAIDVAVYGFLIFRRCSFIWSRQFAQSVSEMWQYNELSDECLS
jgi:hypothetical protein